MLSIQSVSVNRQGCPQHQCHGYQGTLWYVFVHSLFENYIDSTPPGGYSKFVEQGLNGEWLPSWFQENAYNTYYVGKLMNNHSVMNYNNPYPKGFNSTDCTPSNLIREFLG